MPRLAAIMDAVRVAYTLEQCWHDVPGGTAVAAIEMARRAGRRERRDARRRGRAPPPPARAAVATADPRRPAAARPARALRDVAAAAPAPRRAGDRRRRRRPRHRAGAVPRPRAARRHDARRRLRPRPEPVQPPGAAGDAPQPRRDPRRAPSSSRRRGEPPRPRGRPASSPPASASSRSASTRRRGDPPTSTAGPPGRTACPIASPCSSARSSRARTSAGSPPRWPALDDAAAARRRRSRRLGRRRRRARAADVRFLGFVPAADLPALYAAATVFAYPSEREGFGLPVAEAMAQGTPVVTSRGTATEEVAGGAAVLVDPFDVDAIAAGIDAAQRAPPSWLAGRARAAELTWAPPPSARSARTGRGQRSLVTDAPATWRSRQPAVVPARAGRRLGGVPRPPARRAARRGAGDPRPPVRRRPATPPPTASCAARHELVVASLDARRRSRRVLAEATWLPGRDARRRRRPPRRRHGAAALAAARSC